MVVSMIEPSRPEVAAVAVALMEAEFRANGLPLPRAEGEMAEIMIAVALETYTDQATAAIVALRRMDVEAKRP